MENDNSESQRRVGENDGNLLLRKRKGNEMPCESSKDDIPMNQHGVIPDIYDHQCGGQWRNEDQSGKE